MKLEQIKSKLIVSCQAPSDSPLHHEKIIAAIAQACIGRGAAGLRLDTPAHIREVRHCLGSIPIIGLWKRQFSGYDVYITPRFQEAMAIAQAGADIIAIDGTIRPRPHGENLKELVKRIKGELGKLVMADVDTLNNAIVAAEAGVDLVGTTLYGYTQETQHLSPPGFSLLTDIIEKLDIPVICEGGIQTPQQGKTALELGAYAIVVGAAITGIDLKVQAFQSVID
ncbi:N-acylglucosamine-6-phosphate 2-epimerase [Gloeothece citriformis PCC 7424]|uniref:Putative N-acetylmannosamine-6-phosphate 2-epimerase n=1 Tax=Gloeothece citriformis (strain PCC 7424) TaxID=65393 RepID=B7KI97_GLOC7|nr:N-acetylmannosamine-6-phosphate 2-epimerase [Gloeothece citriformis]ACK73584.1 N-acylglucosamine-6-phosphate 2-epimerase [Gloeothece citriformis PCC 7424]